MNKHGFDSKVKKTLVRNCEQRAKPSARKQTAVLDMGCSNLPSDRNSQSPQKENRLSQPSLCSSEALAHYLNDAKKSLPSVPHEDVDKHISGSKMTKKLNFHFNNRIYKNLIELNASIEDLKSKKDKRSTFSAGSTKRDVEPNIEDFCYDEKESDVVPVIPVIKHKFKPVRKVENGQLHKLISSFEDL